MRVPRSSLMALAALLTGTLASAGAFGAETAARDKALADTPPSSPPAQSSPSDPVTTALPDYKPDAPAAEPAPAPTVAAPVAPVVVLPKHVELALAVVE